MGSRPWRSCSPGMDDIDTSLDVAGARSVARIRRISAHVAMTEPFSADALDEHPHLKDCAYLELRPATRVYALACAFITEFGQVASFRYSPEKIGDIDEGNPAFEPVASTYATLGLGVFRFSWKQHEMHALHQAVGPPVGLNNTADVYTSLVLFVPRAQAALLGRFCRELVMESERSQAGFVSVFEWNALNQYWMARVICPARPLHTVVLEQDKKSRLLEDIKEFLGPDARQWYKDHGIQHKRGYLFYGPPGTGKTSMIQALASHFEHNLCSVHLTHPNLTDDSLRAAVNQAPKKSILVFEDVDAIFGHNREKHIPDSPLSFSGLLNALDGVGKADGQIFILTTNHRDRLNPALIRNGRADMHIEFLVASDEQITGLFGKFYPFSTDAMRRSFVDALRGVLAGRSVTPAALQHFFILHRRSSAAQAAQSAQDVVEELERREDEQRMHEEDTAKKRAEKEAKESKSSAPSKAKKQQE